MFTLDGEGRDNSLCSLWTMKEAITHYVHFCVAVFHVDLLDILNDVVTQRLTEQRVLASEQPKEQLQ